MSLESSQERKTKEDAPLNPGIIFSSQDSGPSLTAADYPENEVADVQPPRFSPRL